MFVGVSQSGMTGGANAQMFELTFTASQTSGNLPERVGSPQLAEQHGYKLAPRGESSGMTFGPGFLDHHLELQPRKQLQYLTEHATILIQLEPSFGLICFG